MILNNIKDKQKGFTIVELLVVIVVIGILAAITIVSYTGISARATKSANQANADSVVSAAEAVYADSGIYPVASATAATMLTNLNAGPAKVPSSIVVTNTTVLSTTSSNISYRQNAALTGICVGYWDPTPTAIARYMFSGTAVSDNGTTCV